MNTEDHSKLKPRFSNTENVERVISNSVDNTNIHANAPLPKHNPNKGDLSFHRSLTQKRDKSPISRPRKHDTTLGMMKMNVGDSHASRHCDKKYSSVLEGPASKEILKDVHLRRQDLTG